MRNTDCSPGSASNGADAKLVVVDYQVLDLHATVKSDLHVSTLKGSLKPHFAPSNTILATFQQLCDVLEAKQQLLAGDANVDADWEWEVSCTTTDAQCFLHAVQHAALQLNARANSDAPHDIARSAVKAAADLAVQDLCELALAIKRSWEGLTRHQKQSDHTPLDLVCSAGLLLSRLYACAAACAANGPLQQQAAVLLQQICSRPAQQLLQESLAGHLFIFRWHEQQQQQEEEGHCPAAPSTDSTGFSSSSTSSSSSSNGMCGTLASIIQTGYNRYSPQLQALNPVGTNQHNPEPQATSKTPSAVSAAAEPCIVPRLVSAPHVPQKHGKWISHFMLPVVPTAAHWRSAQEVLFCWNDVISRADSLGVTVEVDTDTFMLTLEALWLFAQPAAGYQSSAAAAAAHGEPQLQQLWPTILLRLLAHVESSAAAAAAGSSPPAAAAAAALRSDLIQPAGSVLFGMLAEALLLLAHLWQQQPAAARAATIRSVISESDLTVITRQKRVTNLLGKSKPKVSEVAISQVLLLVKGVAAVLVELLQLERTLCGGPARDGKMPHDDAGEETPWFSCLWDKTPTAMAQALELLLRCPTPVCTATTTLIELLMDDMWEAIRLLPLLEPGSSSSGGGNCSTCKFPAAAVAAAADQPDRFDPAAARAVAAAVISSQKAVRSWQAAISQVLLLPDSLAAAAAGGTPAAAAAAGQGSAVARKCTPRKVSSISRISAKKVEANRTAAAPTAAAAGSSPVAAAADSAAAAAPGWLLAAVEADPCAAVGVMLTLLSRGLDCAQKAYYWRWYTWWKQQQQQQHAATDTVAAPVSAAAAAGGVALGTSCSSSTGSSSGSSSDSFLSSSSSSSSSSDDAEIDPAVEAAAAAAVIEGKPLAAAELLSSGSSAQIQNSSALWGNAAVQCALGFTALAGPAFAFVDSVTKQFEKCYKYLPESQRKQMTECTLGLLESVSAGLQSNSLMLVELKRLLLLPWHNTAAAAAPAATCLSKQLDTMLANALTAAAAAGDNTTSRFSTSSRSKSGKPTTATAAAAAAGSSAATTAAPARLSPPGITASLDTYDTYWQKLTFDPVDQLTLSKAAAGFISATGVVLNPNPLVSTILPHPAGCCNHVGCYNPDCYNILGFSECHVKTLACRACRQVGYCSRACQKHHWKVHKGECRQWQQQQDCEWVEVFSEDFSDLLLDE